MSEGLSGGNNQDIGELIEQISKGPNNDPNQFYSVVGEVTEVNEAERTVKVTPINGDADIIGARLQASKDLNKGIVVFPKLNSFVIVTFLNKYTGYVALVSEVDKIVIENEQESLKTLINDLIEQIKLITVPTAVGPSGTPVNAAAFKAIDDRVNKLFKQ